MTSNREIVISHQDMLVDRDHLQDFRRQGGTPSTTVAGDVQCGLTGMWKDPETGSWMGRSDRYLAIHEVSSSAMIFPRGLIKQVMPLLVKLKEMFAAAGGR
jgi:hypothetical protein